MTSPSAMFIRIGTAGWNIPAEYKTVFPSDRSHLERYANIFGAVEINSSFHRPHRVSTYQRWAASVPETFRFAVKIPKQITHVHKLQEVEVQLHEFLAQVAGLGSKLGPLLVQLPPSLPFTLGTAERFFGELRKRVAGPIACEPRHASWFQPEADRMLINYRVARVAADPSAVDLARHPGGWRGLTYMRLHGSPRMYYSAYSHKAIQAVVTSLVASARDGSEPWCMFDNTAAGAATQNALTATREIADDIRTG